MASWAAPQDRIQTLTEYDQLAYINRPYVQTHPDHMAVLARLHGLEPPPVERARVLDIGTSEGGNLIPLALTLPQAEFVGIDLASTPVERGQAVIRDLGLTNIRLLQFNLLDVDAAFGKFDYIIAHGLYGWTPRQVRDKVMEVARVNLSPHGIAFISYNTHPGGHLRMMVRDMMLFHAARFEAAGDRVKAARAMLELIAAGRPEPDPVEQAVAYQARTALERSDSSLFHDYLAPVFEPSYFQDFAAHAAREGLAYVADASVADTYNMKLSAAALEAVRVAAPAGRIFQEQYLDLLRFRRFRRSLVCHAQWKPVARWNPARAAGLHASSTITETGDMEFTAPGGLKITLDAAAAGFVRGLMAMWPRSRPLEPHETDLALELFRRDMIELGTVPSPAATAGERPVASPLARYQAARGEPTVSTLHHRALAVEDDRARRLLTLLDGSRDRDSLAREMDCERQKIDEELASLASLAVLLG